MLRTLIEKELKAILLSPKFVAVFAVCSILIILSIYIGIDEYKTSVNHYEAVNAQLAQQLRERTEWSGLRTNIVRRPDPMEIFVTGINNDIGRQSPISQSIVVKLYGSRYSDQLLFSIFRSMDLMFIVQIVLSLFAILFTYDSICGERETGTLKLNFANPIPRTRYIISKLIGSWLGLVIPLLIPLLLGITMVLIYRIPMNSTNWIQLFMLIGISVLYFTFFICLGVLFSSISRGPSGSFLYLLVIWISFVLIIPRAGIMAAGQFTEVPPAAEISSKLTQKRRETSDQLMKWFNENTRKRASALAALSKEERPSKSQEIYDQYNRNLMEKQAELMQEIDNYYTSLIEDWRNRKSELERFGFSLSRFSPASAYQLAAMSLAGTGLSLKSDYEDQLHDYKVIFSKFVYKKAEEERNVTPIGMTGGTEPKNININEIPEFTYTHQELNLVLQTVVIDVGIISLYILITIAGAFVAFIRYDVR